MLRPSAVTAGHIAWSTVELFQEKKYLSIANLKTFWDKAKGIHSDFL
jgi:hypothetical protein